jgi:hypothetical protein
MKMTPLERAAKVQFESDKLAASTLTWDTLADDTRGVYLRQMRKVFRAAGISPGYACGCGHSCGEAPPRLLEDNDEPGRELR